MYSTKCRLVQVILQDIIMCITKVSCDCKTTTVLLLFWDLHRITNCYIT